MLLDMLFAHRAEGARLRDRHALPLPGDVRALARGRAALRHEGRGVRRPERRAARREARRGALGAQARPLSRDRARSSRSSARSAASTLDHRRPPRPVADARQRAEARLGRGARALEGEPARRLERRRLLGVHPRARAALQRAARPRLRLDRRHALARSRAPAARAAGPAATAPSAASTSKGSRHEPVGVASDPVASRRARVRGDPHHARGRRRAGAAGAALLGRQGLDRDAAPRREGVPAGASSRSRSCTSTRATTSPR